MSRISLLVLFGLVISASSVRPAGRADDEKIIGVWERETEKDELEETWAIKKNKDNKWTVSGSFWKSGKNGEVGNFKGKDVKYVDGTLSFTQEYFKLPKGRENGTMITASTEGDRLDITAKKGSVETRDNMERAGDANEVVGTWSKITLGMKEVWVIAKDKNGVLSVRGTFSKDGKELGSFKGVNVRYFKHVLCFNQEYIKLPSPNMTNGSAIACVGKGEEMPYIWSKGKEEGKAKLKKE